LALFKTSGGKYDQLGGKGKLDQTVNLSKKMNEEDGEKKNDFMSQTVQFTKAKFESEQKKKVEDVRVSKIVDEEATKEKDEECESKKTVETMEMDTSNSEKEGDLFDVIKRNNIADLESWFDKNSSSDCFKTTPEGVSAIEFAFTSGNIEAGRFLVKLVQKHHPVKSNSKIVQSPWLRTQSAHPLASTTKVDQRSTTDSNWIKKSDNEIKTSFVLANTVGPSMIGKLSENAWRQKEAESKPEELPKIVRRISKDSSWIQNSMLSGTAPEGESSSETRRKSVVNDESWVKSNTSSEHHHMEIEDESEVILDQQTLTA
jgi:hypothetical protein